MSKSTPITQLQHISPAQLQSIPEAEATVQDVTMEFGGLHAPLGNTAAGANMAPGAMHAGQYYQQQQQQLQLHALAKPFVTPEDIKILLMTATVFLLLANEPLTAMMMARIPGLRSPVICLIVRAALAGLLVAAINKFV